MKQPPHSAACSKPEKRLNKEEAMQLRFNVPQTHGVSRSQGEPKVLEADGGGSSITAKPPREEGSVQKHELVTNNLIPHISWTPTSRAIPTIS